MTFHLFHLYKSTFEKSGAKYGAKSGQNMDKIWAKSGQNLGKIWTKSGQNLGKIWAKSGQNLGKILLHFSQKWMIWLHLS